MRRSQEQPIGPHASVDPAERPAKRVRCVAGRQIHEPRSLLADSPADWSSTKDSAQVSVAVMPAPQVFRWLCSGAGRQQLDDMMARSMVSTRVLHAFDGSEARETQIWHNSLTTFGFIAANGGATSPKL